MAGRPERGMGFPRDDRNERRWRDVDVRPLTTSRPQLRTADLGAAGLLEPGARGRLEGRGEDDALAWSIDWAIEADADGEEARLALHVPDGAVRCDALMLERVPCRIGGVQAWLRCPRCIERRAVFFLDLRARTSHALECRSCAGLVYPSQRMREHERLEARAEQIAERLDRDENGDLVRPKGMHHRTFKRLLVERARLLDAAGDALFEYVENHARAREARQEANRRAWAVEKAGCNPHAPVG